MAKDKFTKLKLLHLGRMLYEETDDDHGLSMSSIIQRLAELGISAERKSLYQDLKALQDFGLTIERLPRHPVEYALVKRPFSLPELMLMADAVASSKFLTKRQAKHLIEGISSLASKPQQEKLQRQIHVVGRIRSKNESVFEVVDAIHAALREKKKISFRYLRYGADGKRHASHQGKRYVVTPVGVAYDNGHYYVTCWTDENCFKEYRADRMGSLMVSDEPAQRNEKIATYSATKDEYEYFGRFDGEATTVQLAVKSDRVEIIFDRFGNDVRMGTSKGDYATASVKVRVSPQFFGWLAGLNRVVRLVGSAKVVAEYREYLQALIDDPLPEKV